MAKKISVEAKIEFEIELNDGQTIEQYLEQNKDLKFSVVGSKYFDKVTLHKTI